MKHDHIIAIVNAIDQANDLPENKEFNPLFNTLYEIADQNSINAFAKDALKDNIEAKHDDTIMWFKEQLQHITIDDKVLNTFIANLVEHVRDEYKKKKNYKENSALNGLFNTLNELSDANSDDYDIKLEFARSVIDQNLEADDTGFSDTVEWIKKHAAEFTPDPAEFADNLIGMGELEREQYIDDMLMHLPLHVRQYIKNKA